MRRTAVVIALVAVALFIAIASTGTGVLAPDPHRFDGDRDGIGCET